MDKLIKVEIVGGLNPDNAMDMHFDFTTGDPILYTPLFKNECTNIIEHVTNDIGDVTSNDARKAIDVLIAYMALRQTHSLVVNIQERNDSLKPCKEMTLKEIEKQLGYKVRIIPEWLDKIKNTMEEE